VEERESDLMGTGPGPTRAPDAERAEALPEIRPWREVGWIFKDGDALAIERQDDRVRERLARMAHRPDG
jgi:hypothetical protein